MNGISPPLIAVSIQLGSSCYRVGRLQNGSPVTLLNKFGKDETPAYFALDGEDALYGDDAVAYASIQPRMSHNGVIKQVRRDPATGPLPGDMTAEEILRQTLKGIILDAIPNWDGKPAISAVVVTCANSYLQNSPCAIKNIVKSALENQFPNVMTAVVPKSTSAFVAFAMHSEKVPDGRYLILVIGASVTEMATFDVNNNIATSINGLSSTDFGGEIFDRLLVEQCCKQFHEDTGIDATMEPGALLTLLNKCEIAKRRLSAAKVVLLDIPQFCQKKKLKIQITRETLETLGTNAVDQFGSFIKGRCSDDLSGLIVVGGASRMPCLQRKLVEIFPQENLIKTSMIPDAHLAVLNGAAFLTSRCASGELPALLSDDTLDIDLIKSCANNDVLQHLSDTDCSLGDVLPPAAHMALDVLDTSQQVDTTQEMTLSGPAIIEKDLGLDLVSEKSGGNGDEDNPHSSSPQPKTSDQLEQENVETDDECDVSTSLLEKNASNVSCSSAFLVAAATCSGLAHGCEEQQYEYPHPEMSTATQFSPVRVIVEQPRVDTADQLPARDYGTITSQISTISAEAPSHKKRPKKDKSCRSCWTSGWFSQCCNSQTRTE